MKIFITGEPGCGKTSLIKEFLNGYKGNVTGILSEERREKGVRTGFEIVNLKTEEKGILASIHQKQGPRIGKYIVNLFDLERIAIPALERKADLIVIDEIGKMELCSEKFKRTLNKIIQSDSNVLAVLGRNYIEEYKKYGEVIWLRKEDYAEILDKIKNYLSR